MGSPLSFDLKNGSAVRVCILQTGPVFNASHPQQWVLAWECHPTPTSPAPTSMPMTVAPLCLVNLRGPSPLRGISRGWELRGDSGSGGSNSSCDDDSSASSAHCRHRLHAGRPCSTVERMCFSSARMGETAASPSLPTPSLLTPQQKDSPTNTTSYGAVSLVRIRNSGITQNQAEGLLKVLELIISFYRLNFLLYLMTNSPWCF